MNNETIWLLTSLALAGAGLTVSLLWIFRRQQAAMRDWIQADRAGAAENRKVLLELVEQLRRTAERKQEVPTAGPPPPAPNRRSEVLRLADLGARADQISETLRLPLNEVNLLLRLRESMNGR